MKFILILYLIVAFQISRSPVQAQSHSTDSTRRYSHKAVVDSVIQTKAYTYIKVSERVNDKDSLQWMALPLFNPMQGDIYYFDNGLQMGEFHSKELNRTFNQICFMGFVSTSAEVSDKTILPKPVMDTIPVDAPPTVLHSVLIKEVIQAGGYTYLKAIENGVEEWIAVVKQQAKAGEQYTYEDATVMKQFKSRELERTFDEVLFVAKLTRIEAGTDKYGQDNLKEAKKVSKNQAKNIKENKVIKLSKLFKDREQYVNKIVKVNGEVTKFNANILGKNWIHLEDGTSIPGKTDILITIDEEVKTGDKITVEGQFTVDRDFGSGYHFDMMIENGKVISEIK